MKRFVELRTEAEADVAGVGEADAVGDPAQSPAPNWLLGAGVAAAFPP